jgi:dimethylglycine dehydrogenase
LYFPDHRGRIVTEMTCMVHSDNDVGLITAAVAQSHDADWLRRGLPEGVVIEDHTDAANCFIVTGPKARDLLAGLCDADLSAPWLSILQGVRFGAAEVTLLRVSFAGELGWEVHAARVDAPAVYEALLAGGAVPFGMRALNSLRIEKGYRAWKGDLSTDYSLLEGGLERFVDWSGEFPGKAALAAEKQRGVAKRFVSLKVGACDCDPPYMSNVWVGDRVVGEITSAAMGYRVGHVVALGMLKAEAAVKGQAVEIEVFGERIPAEVVGFGAQWDAANARLKA